MAKRNAKSILSTLAYPFIDAANCLHIPLSTLRAWFLGQGYRSDGKTRRFRPAIRLGGKDRRPLSFRNLAEVHVFAVIRSQHHVSLLGKLAPGHKVSLCSLRDPDQNLVVLAQGGRPS